MKVTNNSRINAALELAAERGDAAYALAVTLADRARRLGEEHAAAGSAPFGTAEHVYWDNGGEDALLAALGETGPYTHENFPARYAAKAAYCGALDSEECRFWLPFMSPERRHRLLAALKKELAERGLPLHELFESPQ